MFLGINDQIVFLTFAAQEIALFHSLQEGMQLFFIRSIADQCGENDLPAGRQSNSQGSKGTRGFVFPNLPHCKQFFNAAPLKKPRIIVRLAFAKDDRGINDDVIPQNIASLSKKAQIEISARYPSDIGNIRWALFQPEKWYPTHLPDPHQCLDVSRGKLDEILIHAVREYTRQTIEDLEVGGGSPQILHPQLSYQRWDRLIN